MARRVVRWKAMGDDLVVVPSAMSGELNRLIALAMAVSSSPDPSELAVCGLNKALELDESLTEGGGIAIVRPFVDAGDVAERSKALPC